MPDYHIIPLNLVFINSEPSITFSFDLENPSQFHVSLQSQFLPDLTMGCRLQIKGMNSLFGLRVRVTVGERLIVGVATATAVFLTALPHPPVPRVTSGGSGREDERRRVEVQKLLHATIARNKECYGLKHLPAVTCRTFLVLYSLGVEVVIEKFI